MANLQDFTDIFTKGPDVLNRPAAPAAPLPVMPTAAAPAAVPAPVAPAPAPVAAAPASSGNAWPFTSSMVSKYGAMADKAFSEGRPVGGVANLVGGAVMAPVGAAADLMNQGGEGVAAIGRAALHQFGVATPTDAATAQAAPNAPPAPNPQQQLGKSGFSADSHMLGQSHPSTHTAEQFAAMNSHLTPRDLQIMTGFLQNPHDKIMQAMGDQSGATLAANLAQADQAYKNAEDAANGNPDKIKAAAAVRDQAKIGHYDKHTERLGGILNSSMGLARYYNQQGNYPQ